MTIDTARLTSSHRNKTIEINAMRRGHRLISSGWNNLVLELERLGESAPLDHKDQTAVSDKPLVLNPGSIYDPPILINFEQNDELIMQFP